MLHLIPPPAHRQLYRLADWLRRRWWRIARPRRRSANVAAFDDAGRVLLVRHSYGPPVWSLPGGAIDRGEDPHAAAAREFREELGCALADLTALGASLHDIGGATDELHLFAGRVAGVPQPDMREIVAVGFFEPDALPAPVDRRVVEWVRRAVSARIGRARS